MVGDGCEVCNPAKALEYAKQTIEDQASDLDAMRAELDKEQAHSKYLAEAMSRQIDERIAVENQCAYYRTQYTRAETIRKEACEANVKAQTRMLWLEDDNKALRARLEQAEEALTEIAEWTDRYTSPGHPIGTVARAAIAGEKK